MLHKPCNSLRVLLFRFSHVGAGPKAGPVAPSAGGVEPTPHIKDGLAVKRSVLNSTKEVTVVMNCCCLLSLEERTFLYKKEENNLTIFIHY